MSRAKNRVNAMNEFVQILESLEKPEDTLMLIATAILFLAAKTHITLDEALTHARRMVVNARELGLDLSDEPPN